MTTPLGFDGLKDILHRRTAQLPDHRKESPNTRYAIHDAALGAFGIFFTQSPSFLEYQRRLQHTKGHNNAQTLFDVEQIPCDNQVRTLLDPIPPSDLDAVFVEVFERLEQHRLLAPFRVLGDQLLGGPGWHQLLFVQSHSLSKLSQASAHQRPNSLLSCRYHPGDRLPWTARSSPCRQSTSCRKTAMTNRTVNGRRANAGSANMPSSSRLMASPYWAMISTASSPFVPWCYSMVSTSSLRANPTPIPTL